MRVQLNALADRHIPSVQTVIEADAVQAACAPVGLRGGERRGIVQHRMRLTIA